MLKNRMTILAVGILGNQVLVWSFDYLLYPFVLYNFGLKMGGPLMIFLSFIVCLATLFLYDFLQKDWLGIEMIKKFKTSDAHSRLHQFTSRLLNKSDWFVMILLSLRFDPFITTIYMRKGVNEYNGMKKRDWMIFLTSLTISNLYWLIVVEAGIDFFKYLRICLL